VNSLDLVSDLPAIENQIKSVSFEISKNNQPVQIHHLPPPLTLIGKGTDAIVIQHSNYPNYVFKVFAPERLNKLPEEYSVYQILQGSSFFPICYHKGENYLALSYEQGPTLYDCLLQGIVIPKQVIEDVEDARSYVRKKGLNPRDIHLKNVLLQNNGAKIVDLSEFVRSGDDQRWDHMVEGYRHYYSYIQGMKIPSWLMEWVKTAYYRQSPKDFSIEDFTQSFLTYLTKRRK
jgi:predicted Ser/Thr protein kinase